MWRKYLKLSIKELKGAYQVVVEKSNGKEVVVKSFESLEAAQSYQKEFRSEV